MRKKLITAATKWVFRQRWFLNNFPNGAFYGIGWVPNPYAKPTMTVSWTRGEPISTASNSTATFVVNGGTWS